MNTILYIVSFLFLGYSRVGECIKCWECNSKYDPNCADPFKPHTMALADCSQRFLGQDVAAEATICRKLTQKVRNEERIIRGCGYLSPEEAGTCLYRAGTHMVFMEYCQCAGEGCNKAGNLHHPQIMQVLLPALLIILLYLFS